MVELKILTHNFELTPQEVAHIESYEEALEAYLSYIPSSIIRKKVRNIDEAIKTDGWQAIRAKRLLNSMSLNDVAPDLPDVVKVTVFKLNIIKKFVEAKIIWAKSLYLHTLREKVDNYTLKVKLADYGDWDGDVWGVTVIEDISSLVGLDWVMLLDGADERDIETHTKVLMDKLELQKTFKHKKPFKDPQGHADRCKELNIGIFDYDEDYVLERYDFVFGD